MYKILGITNVIIALIMVTPFALLELNKRYIKTKNKNFLGLVKFLRPLHKPLGGLLVLSAMVHGYLALGSLQFHTGIALFIVVLITASLGGAFVLLKKKGILTTHKMFAGLVFVMIIIHRFLPNAFS